MRVKCIKNELTAIHEVDVRERIGQSVHIEGAITDLMLGREYVVQAIEQRDGGVWLYLHTTAVNDYPYPYPAELFEFLDTSLPGNWSLCIRTQIGNVIWKRIAFSEWASDDHFYERLVDGDAEAVSLYRSRMARA